MLKDIIVVRMMLKSVAIGYPFFDTLRETNSNNKITLVIGNRDYRNVFVPFGFSQLVVTEIKVQVTTRRNL